jgi:hypothetical protein
VKITCIVLLFIGLIFLSCGQKISETPKGCITTFIISAEQHDINKCWDCLGKDAKTFYNDIGDKMRKSGKGALENEINKINTFRNAQKDYSMRKDKDSVNIIHMFTGGGQEFVINLIEEDGAFKIRDGNSVKSILNVISADIINQKPY